MFSCRSEFRIGIQTAGTYIPDTKISSALKGLEIAIQNTQTMSSKRSEIFKWLFVGLFVGVNTLTRRSGADVPNISLSPDIRDLTTAVGQSVVIRCTVTETRGFGDYSLFWRDNDGSRITATAGSKFVSAVDSDIWLYLNPVQDGDAGIYTCEAEFDDVGYFTSDYFNLHFYAPISFDNAPIHQVFVPGRDALVVCEVSGYPLPTVSWRHDHRRIVEGEKFVISDGGLTITDINVDDEGIYVCRAEVEELGILDQLNIMVSIKGDRTEWL